jgi:prepilin-type processing-associated H-X9-DG protein
LQADETQPDTVLSGDRSLSISKTNFSGVMTVTSNSVLRVVPGMHPDGLNLAFGDGSARQLSEEMARRWILETNTPPIYLVVP